MVSLRSEIGQKNMTNSEIAALVKRVDLGMVWWHDDDHRIHRVRTVQLEGEASPNTEEVKEPMALLMDGKTIALDTAKVRCSRPCCLALDSKENHDQHNSIYTVHRGSFQGRESLGAGPACQRQTGFDG